MSTIQGKHHIIDGNGNFIITNAGCRVMSFLNLCSFFIKIVRARTENAIRIISCKIKEYQL
jgi:hypothetical protein